MKFDQICVICEHLLEFDRSGYLNTCGDACRMPGLINVELIAYVPVVLQANLKLSNMLFPHAMLTAPLRPHPNLLISPVLLKVMR